MSENKNISESQGHGFIVEKEIINSKINIILENHFDYTGEYDIPPMQIKTLKMQYNNKKEIKSTIEFGSLLRKIKSKTPYILIIVGYEQNKNIKKITFSDSIYISEEIINIINGELTVDEVIYLEQSLKSFKTGKHKDAREWAKQAKIEYNPKTIFDIRFKIDSKNQRRIQCAIDLIKLYDICKKNLILENKYSISDINSTARKRNKIKLDH